MLTMIRIMVIIGDGGGIRYVGTMSEKNIFHLIFLRTSTVLSVVLLGVIIVGR